MNIELEIPSSRVPRVRAPQKPHSSVAIDRLAKTACDTVRASLPPGIRLRRNVREGVVTHDPTLLVRLMQQLLRGCVDQLLGDVRDVELVLRIASDWRGLVLGVDTTRHTAGRPAGPVPLAFDGPAWSRWPGAKLEDVCIRVRELGGSVRSGRHGGLGAWIEITLPRELGSGKRGAWSLSLSPEPGGSVRGMADLGVFALNAGELHEELALASGDVCEVDRRVLFMHHVEGRTLEEIARSLSLAEPVVRERLSRAVHSMRRTLFPAIAKPPSRWRAIPGLSEASRCGT